MATLHEQLKEWAKEYNTLSFIENDPVQFPRKYKDSPVDAEISGLLTALISFGSRKQIIKKAQELDGMFEGKPVEWIMQNKFRRAFDMGNKSFYRTISHKTMYWHCYRIQSLLLAHGSLHKCLRYATDNVREFEGKSYFDVLKKAFGFIDESAAKRLAMFLRWMVRDDGIVDLGIWKGVDKKDLIIPLDAHVHRMALELGITNRKTPDIKTAQEITDYFKTIWPDDPCLGDFALFGYGVNHKRP